MYLIYCKYIHDSLGCLHGFVPHIYFVLEGYSECVIEVLSQIQESIKKNKMLVFNQHVITTTCGAVGIFFVLLHVGFNPLPLNIQGS